MQPYKFGNTFTDRATERASRPTSVNEAFGDVETTSLIMSTHSNDHTPTPDTTFDMVAGPVTETEQRGRSLVREQRANMEASLKSRSPAKTIRKRSNTDTSKSSKSTKEEHKSALPIPLFFGRMKSKLASKKSKANLRGDGPMTVPDTNKPLPAISVSATIEPTDPSYSQIPNFLTMPSPSPRFARSPAPPGSYSPSSPLNPTARPFVPVSPADVEWPLQSSSPVPPVQFVPRVPRKPAAATSTLPSGVIFANQQGQTHFIAPARKDTYAYVQQPKVVPASPTHASMHANIVEQAPAIPVTAAPSEEIEGAEAAVAAEVAPPAGVTLEELQGELFAVCEALNMRVDQLEARFGRVEAALGRVETMLREGRVQMKRDAAFGGRYPGDAKNLLAWK
ncbi:uncharacterized protein HMPREF1541_06072 [Cyphellophora europaea CBS 101466]|uniref:Uncharacterized protein n=1 Tax=Cyphellophora europaea (strain CBS 101466) TaxID=1220924 RepID=W2RTL6_CYPE1|nr:uncharacterized protein HMPREF1541_06072 [Cyphellophora europaea CBS 101466]ETN39846.1 hypothetical protein HMPREF1541_06072 [Cyphellophora europaea CBS 101466]